MSNKHYDLSTDAEEEEEVLDVVRAKSPDKAEDDEHNQTHIHQQHQLSFDNNVQAGEEEEHQGEREHLPDSPHNLEGEIHQPHSNREDEIDEGVQLTNRSGQQFQQRQLTPEIEGTPRTRRDSTVVAEAQQQEEEEEEEEEEAEIERSLMEEPKPTHKGHLEKMEHSQQSEDKQEEEEEDEDEDEGTTSQHAATENLYDAAEFQNLPVGTDIKELFQFITAYAAQVIETETVLKPFILDFIPSVGDIDAFIKVTRPDDADDSLGLTVLDEPAAEQSDPTVLDGVPLKTENKEENGETTNFDHFKKLPPEQAEEDWLQQESVEQKVSNPIRNTVLFHRDDAEKEMSEHKNQTKRKTKHLMTKNKEERFRDERPASGRQRPPRQSNNNSVALPKSDKIIYDQELDLLESEGCGQLSDALRKSRIRVQHPTNVYDIKKSIKNFAMNPNSCPNCSGRFQSNVEAERLEVNEVEKEEEDVNSQAQKQKTVWKQVSDDSPDSDADDKLESSSKGWNIQKKAESDSD